MYINNVSIPDAQPQKLDIKETIGCKASFKLGDDDEGDGEREEYSGCL